MPLGGGRIGPGKTWTRHWETVTMKREYNRDHSIDAMRYTFHTRTGIPNNRRLIMTWKQRLTARKILYVVAIALSGYAAGWAGALAVMFICTVIHDVAEHG